MGLEYKGKEWSAVCGVSRAAQSAKRQFTIATTRDFRLDLGASISGEQFQIPPREKWADVCFGAE